MGQNHTEAGVKACLKLTMNHKFNKVNSIKVLQGLNAMKKQEVLSNYMIIAMSSKLNLNQELMVSK